MSSTEPTSPAPAPTFREAFRHMPARTAGWVGAVAGALVIVAAVLSLMGFGILNLNSGGLVRLDPSRVALQIQTEYKDELGIVAKVECPANLVAPLNFSFKCMAQSGAAVATVDVMIIDVLGNILWTPESDLPVE